MRVKAEDDPDVAGDLVRAHEHLSVFLLHPRDSSIDIFDIEVVKTEGNG